MIIISQRRTRTVRSALVHREPHETVNLTPVRLAAATYSGMDEAINVAYVNPQ